MSHPFETSKSARASDALGIVVLGMHRSGTSALTGAISSLGVHLGARLLEPASDNIKGYFENADAVAIDERLLVALGRNWDDLRQLPPDWESHPAAELARCEAASLLDRDLGARPCWALKDPRLCLLLPIWRDAWTALSAGPLRAIVMLRHPYEVVRSLQRRDGMSPMAALLLWFSHLEGAIVHSNNMPRTWTSYDALLSDPVGTLKQIGRELGFDWPLDPSAESAALRSFLSTDERHHRARDDGAPQGLEPQLAAHAVEFHDRLVAADSAEAFGHQARVGLEIFRAWRDENACWLAPLTDLQSAVADAQASVAAPLLSRCDELSKRIGELEVALAAAQELAYTRLDVAEREGHARSLAEKLLDATRRELCVAQEGLVRLDALAQERMRHIEEIDKQLAQVRHLALTRLDDIMALDARLAETDVALKHASSLAQERASKLVDTDEALAYAQTLAISRLTDLQACERAMLSARHELAVLTLELERTGAESVSLQDRLERPIVRAASRFDAWWRQFGRDRGKGA